MVVVGEDERDGAEGLLLKIDVLVFVVVGGMGDEGRDDNAFTVSSGTLCGHSFPTVAVAVVMEAVEDVDGVRDAGFHKLGTSGAFVVVVWKVILGDAAGSDGEDDDSISHLI